MKKIFLILFLYSILCFYPRVAVSQELTGGTVTGNVNVDAQVYTEDSKLGISDSTLNFKKLGLNGFTNVLYSIGNFNAGLRFESYLNHMIGFDPRYEGVGVPYWFASYKLGSLNMTAGHFYEQFGSGLILHSWEE